MTAGERFQAGRFRPAKACLPHRSRTPTMTSKQKYTNPQVCEGLGLHQVPMKLATNENLKGMGVIVDDPADFTVEKKTFEISTWPTSGWRKMDPGCGDEAGTCEGKFDIYWDGDFLCPSGVSSRARFRCALEVVSRRYGKNHSIATTSNHYLLGYGKEPTACVKQQRGQGPAESPDSIRLWYSDYHPDGGQLFFPEDGQPFVTNLAPPLGDDVKPSDFTAFYVPAGKGCYIHPGVRGRRPRRLRVDRRALDRAIAEPRRRRSGTTRSTRTRPRGRTGRSSTARAACTRASASTGPRSSASSCRCRSRGRRRSPSSPRSERALIAHARPRPPLS